MSVDELCQIFIVINVTYQLGCSQRVMEILRNLREQGEGEYM